MNLQTVSVSLLLLAVLTTPAVSSGEPIGPIGQYAIMASLDPISEPIPPGGYAFASATVTLLCSMGLYMPGPETVTFTLTTDRPWAEAYLGQYEWTADTTECTLGTQQISKEVRIMVHMVEDAPAFDVAKVTIKAETRHALGIAENQAVSGYAGDLLLAQSHVRLELPAGSQQHVALPTVPIANGETRLTTSIVQNEADLQVGLPSPTITCGTAEPDCRPVMPEVLIQAPSDTVPDAYVLEFRIGATSNDDPSQDAGAVHVPVIVDVVEAVEGSPDAVGELPSPFVVPMLTLLALAGLVRRRAGL